ncbi:DUF6605 domain-containing protein (plasmid) [Geminicoccaceae bacterium 1502E]|nr:DUF6605 domain-containing protein [Geminicoccaceae bacterium 1502E]
MKILAYADALSIRAGRTIGFKISCEEGGAYRASLARVRCGDLNPQGPGWRLEPVAAPLEGFHEGRRQPLRPGSCAIAPLPPGPHRGLRLEVLVRPTLPASEAPQCVLATCGGPDEETLALTVEEGRFVLRRGRAAGETACTARHAILEHCWYRIAAGIDAEGQVFLDVQALDPLHAGFAGERVEAHSAPFVPGGPLTACMAALLAGAERHWHFNGRIEAPRIASGEQILAHWDFSVGIESSRIHDRSPHGCHGDLVNLPARAVTGAAWTGESRDWPADPAAYGAIHFHEDDLHDAGWRTDLVWQVPEDTQSGVYALLLEQEGASYNVPFAVRAARPGRQAKVAFLLPTASYLAYANDHCHLEGANPQLLADRLLELTEADLCLAGRTDLGLSLYDRHRDGSGSFYSSRLRPILNMRAGHTWWLGGPGSGVWQFNADTHILDFLEHHGEAFEVITDEDLHHEGRELLDAYRVVLTGTHPEYYSTAMHEGLRGWLADGGRLLYLGGNGFYWRVAFSDAWPGAIELRRAEDGTRSWAAEPGEYVHAFDGRQGGLWRRNGWPPQRLAGVGFTAQGFGRSTFYRRTPESFGEDVAFIFEGVRSQDVVGDHGLVGGGAAGLELDRAEPALGTPPHARVLLSSTAHPDHFLLAKEEIFVNRPNVHGELSPLIRSDVVFFTLGGQGAVFSTGSIAWCGSLASNGYDNDVARMTLNVIRRFRDPAPFPGPGEIPPAR